MPAATSSIESQTIKKVMWRLMPFLFICYFVAYLDRVNVGFAKLQMNSALGMSDAAFGFGAGLFFIAYFLLEVPSNLALAKFGARLWIARIMLSWGIISGMFAFIQPISHATGVSAEWVFFILRFLLGIAEAGFFPGIIFFLTLWFPSVYRSPRRGDVHARHPLLLHRRRPPFRRPAQRHRRRPGRLAVAVHHRSHPLHPHGDRRGVLPDRPPGAGQLARRRREVLAHRPHRVRNRPQAGRRAHMSIGKAITNGRVMLCAFMYFCLNAASYGVAFFLPTIVKNFGATNFQTGLLAALPFCFGAVGMVLLSRSSDRTLARRTHVVIAMALAGIGLIGAGFSSSPVMILGLLCLSQIGVSAMPPLFWPIPGAFLTGASAAAGIAAINSIGNLSGFFGPYVMGYLKDLTGNFTLGLILLGVTTLVGGAATLLVQVDPKLERTEPQRRPSRVIPRLDRLVGKRPPTIAPKP